MPRIALSRLFRVITEIVQRIGRRAGVNSLGGVECGFFGCLLLQSHPSIKDRQVIVSRQVVRINRLQRFELLQSFIAAMLLIVADAKLPPRVPRLRILRNNLFQIGNLQFGMPLPAFYQRQVIERPRIVGMDC